MTERILGEPGPARKRRLWQLVPALLLALGLLVITAPAVALDTTNPPSFTFVNDQNGADDQPGQKDLSAHAVAPGTVGGDLWVAWKWDVTSLSGGNTGDGCALFDTDGDSKVNFAICVTIAGNPAAKQAVSIYTCGDAKVDRCTSTAALLAGPYASACTVATNASDPFHSGQFDTQATCHIALSEVGATAALLVNTCSYPSTQPNSDPSDCVLIPRDAFIVISKTADPNSGSFEFKVDGTSAFTATGTQTSAQIAVASKPASHSVQEVVPSGWSIDGTPSCTGASGAGSSNGSYANATISGIIANSDNVITCSFSDKQQRGTLNIEKTGGGTTALQGAVFGLFAGSNAVTTGTPDYSCTTGADGKCSMSNIVAGAYTLDETTVPTGFLKASGLPQNITITAGGSQTLQFNDPPAPGRINVSKQDDAGNPLGGAVFTLTGPGASTDTLSCTTRGPSGIPAGLNSNATIPTADGTCSFIDVAPGTYSIDETTVPTGYAKASGLPNNSVVVANGATVNLPSASTSYSDAKQFKVIVLVCQKSDDSLYSSKVAFDADSVPAAANTPTSLPAGVDETAVCQLSGTYVHDNALRANNDHTATVRIP
jgi:hypothetical protein